MKIGLKGGVELAKQPFITLLAQILIVFVMGLVLPLIAFPILRKIGKFKRVDAASIAAHYGSVSNVRFRKWSFTLLILTTL